MITTTAAHPFQPNDLRCTLEFDVKGHFLPYCRSLSVRRRIITININRDKLYARYRKIHTLSTYVFVFTTAS